MKVIISGVCGFIGSHLASRFLKDGHEVVGFDNLSRAGSDHNLKWLKERPGHFRFYLCDLRQGVDVDALLSQHPDASAVMHLGAQVAVTTSVIDPRLDFDINALGTFNLLEAARAHCPKAAFLYASTNKVYGKLDQLAVAEENGRYRYRDCPEGVSESTALDFHSPYGCSKGAADQYVRDYCRIYGMPTVVFRQSCIYGTRQFGLEDQGWVSWFAICAMLGKRVTIYGDGKQVRDVLWIDDLVDLYVKAIERIDRVKGNAYNIGGGPNNTLSLLELLEMLNKLTGTTTKHDFGDWRPGDQRVFVSNTATAERDFDWRRKTPPEHGVKLLLDWTTQSADLLRTFRAESSEVLKVV